MDTMKRLLEVMAALRDPDTGCPWDVEQDFRSIAPYTIEEAYEVNEAIARGDMAALRDELGDLLLQVVFHARMAEEAGQFDFAGVTAAIVDKLVRRHPHVFGTERVTGAREQQDAWEALKARERGDRGVLDGVAIALPALVRATKLGRRAAAVGFDWPDIDGARAKVHEELAEFEATAPADQDARESELGDLLFAVANLARHAGIDPEAALRRANGKFESRFALVEEAVRRSGRPWESYDVPALEAYWQAAKVELDAR
ncbi:MAG: nucleoside triphosphate pyrophosphohydrolase [Gammaproteobacteria bacterium]|nr:nucleoside triphosphate pyrophosphohydrolase [Gammaproteobacteria bacterium]